MADLIDRENYCKNICRAAGLENGCSKSECPLYKAPAVDAVPVVRCEDCEKGEITIEPIGLYLRDFVRCKKRGIYMERTGFCNNGERKDGTE